MTLLSVRKVYQGIADRRQMFRMFDRHAQRPNRWETDDSALYRGEWFEIGEPEYSHMFELLPPLWMRADMFAMREYLTGSITGIFFTLKIDSARRYFHGYCDLADKGSPDRMQRAIIDRECRPVKAMTREERLEHIWSSTHDDYRGYAGERWPAHLRGARTVLFYAGQHGTVFKLLDQLTDAEISAKLPVHLRYLPEQHAA
ncbi:DUF1419 domain-containing protein [Nitrobacter sp.]|uniref:DUF1419 domain-containing protein n=1 Tax=Nitrobacter sp. TaxID=29420 RepID=UPI0029CABEDE|nr:DUF1419 domain-containing protein [Nitrobacter sp.]